MSFPWQMQQPLDAVIFDCDGTLSHLEGIDELAVQNGLGDVVKALTSEAMASAGVTQSLYKERLSLVKPNRDQVKTLGKAYFDQQTPDVDCVIDIFQRLGKTVFILSAGLKLAVDIFASYLHVLNSQVYAVPIEFDASGNYVSFDRTSPLTIPRGKSQVIQQLKPQYPSIMHIGDGMNDVDVKEHVSRFVGYGGVFFRESILAHCDFYIRSLSLAPLLALALTQSEVDGLSKRDRALFDKGLALIANSEVILT